MKKTPRTRRNSVASTTVKVGATTSGRAILGIGELLMLAEGLPVLIEELANFGGEGKALALEMRCLQKEGKGMQAAMLYAKSAPMLSLSAMKGAGRVGMSALVAREAGNAAFPARVRENPPLNPRARYEALKMLAKDPAATPGEVKNAKAAIAKKADAFAAKHGYTNVQKQRAVKKKAHGNPRRAPRTARRNSTKGAYPFAEKEEQYRAASTESLLWQIQDAVEARDAMRGHDEMAENWYADDASTIRKELNRRGVSRSLPKKNPSLLLKEPVNPYSKRWTFKTFKAAYFKGEPVADAIAREFWSDFRYAFVGGLERYIKETTTKL